jgi:EAL domain-containing protein (putative c-di-GMP-specific phosphodiesterase class I)
MEVDLELACARAALGAAHSIAPGLSVGLNFSPNAVLNGALNELGDVGRSIVVEITEHTRTSDYELLRHVLNLAKDIQVAVDDAGAGYASLRHVLELQPHFVKLDIGLVRDVDKDPARAAMVAGMRHFASATGTRLVAEGVERPEQAEVLTELGVELAQGFLFGHPQKLPH